MARTASAKRVQPRDANTKLAHRRLTVMELAERLGFRSYGTALHALAARGSFSKSDRSSPDDRRTGLHKIPCVTVDFDPSRSSDDNGAHCSAVGHSV